MKIYNFLGYGSYTGYIDLKTNFKNPFFEEMELWIWFDHNYENFQFFGYSSYTGYTDIKIKYSKSVC